MGVWFFLTFGIVVVLAQVIPAGILFVSFVSTVLNSQKKNATAREDSLRKKDEGDINESKDDPYRISR